LQQPNSPQPVSKPHRATLGFALSIAGAILILLRGLIRMIAGDVITFAGSDEVRHRFLAGIALNIVGGVAVVFAVLIIAGAYLIYTGMEGAGGTLVIIFSLLSILVGSGWLIGLIIALIGGILGVLKNSQQ
jgi:hypothetical protein